MASLLVLRHLGPFQSKNNNWSTLLCNDPGNSVIFLGVVYGYFDGIPSICPLLQ